MDTNSVKPGWKTSEFWASFAVLVLSYVVNTQLLPEGSTWERVVTLALSVLAALGYTMSRATVKKANSLSSAVAKLPQ